MAALARQDRGCRLSGHAHVAVALLLFLLHPVNAGRRTRCTRRRQPLRSWRQCCWSQHASGPAAGRRKQQPGQQQPDAGAVRSGVRPRQVHAGRSVALAHAGWQHCEQLHWGQRAAFGDWVQLEQGALARGPRPRDARDGRAAAQHYGEGVHVSPRCCRQALANSTRPGTCRQAFAMQHSRVPAGVGVHVRPPPPAKPCLSNFACTPCVPPDATGIFTRSHAALAGAAPMERKARWWT